MANVTDPLAAALHGTDPQNLMEYITRQKIYDSRFWKEECFGLTAVNVLEKACSLTCVGASFGGNRQPTKFLCLVLKLLQIQPSQELVDEFIATEEFKYVRVLGAFYKRLTGRPADIYQALEPLLLDYRKLRYRDIHEWKLLHMDEFVYSLFTEPIVCGIALPRLPQRRVLEEEGYLEGPRTSALQSVLQDMTPQEYLYSKVQEGSEAAKTLWESQQEKSASKREDNGNDKRSQDRDEAARSRQGGQDDVKQREGDQQPRKKPKKEGKGKNYGTLFKSSNGPASRVESNDSSAPAAEGSDEYWNEQRAKLGLKPLKK